MSDAIDVVVIGAGIVGLACAERCAEAGLRVVVLERRGRVAEETSSRNSGVIHAGIYYAPGSLKALCCVDGRERLYARCVRDAIPHRRVGKIIVATEPGELEALEKIAKRAADNGVSLEERTEAELRARAPNVRARAALFSARTGIVDVYALANSYLRHARARDVELALRTDVVGLEQRADASWIVRTRDFDGDEFSVRAGAVINAAGLAADSLAARAGVDIDAAGWRLAFCKGDYFSIHPRVGTLAPHLVYPVPPNHAGLGVHVTVDLAGRWRAGPDTEWVDAPRYDVDERKASQFGDAVRRYLPAIRNSDLSPDYAGTRPKLARPGEPPRDFVIEERPERMIQLIGIESPGITAAGAIAERVFELIRASSRSSSSSSRA